MLLALQKELFFSRKDRCNYFVTMLEKILQGHERSLSLLDKNTFIHLLNEIEQGTNNVGVLFNHHLNNFLAFYFTNGEDFDPSATARPASMRAGRMC